MIGLTPDELDEVNIVTAKFSERAKHDQSLLGSLSSWDKFIGDVETGYEFGIDDYNNDLSLRTILSELCEQIRPEVRKKIESACAPLDQRFSNSTELAPRWFYLPEEAGTWWLCRIPKKLLGELKEDLEARGLKRS